MRIVIFLSIFLIAIGFNENSLQANANNKPKKAKEKDKKEDKPEELTIEGVIQKSGNVVFIVTEHAKIKIPAPKKDDPAIDYKSLLKKHVTLVGTGFKKKPKTKNGHEVIELVSVKSVTEKEAKKEEKDEKAEKKAG